MKRLHFSDLTAVLSCVILTNTFDYVDGMPNHFNMSYQLIVLHILLHTRDRVIFLTLTTTKGHVV